MRLQPNRGGRCNRVDDRWHSHCSSVRDIAKEATMCMKWTRASLLIAALASAPAAWADNQQGGADPGAKALPATASDTARANAFGQQGARSKAAHQAAQAAASQAAHAAASGAQAQPPAAGSSRPAAAATDHASTTGTTNGLDKAAAGSTNGQGSTHRH
jgi:hypothetical protein